MVRCCTSTQVITSIHSAHIGTLEMAKLLEESETKDATRELHEKYSRYKRDNGRFHMESGEYVERHPVLVMAHEPPEGMLTSITRRSTDQAVLHVQNKLTIPTSDWDENSKLLAQGLVSYQHVDS